MPNIRLILPCMAIACAAAMIAATPAQVASSAPAAQTRPTTAGTTFSLNFKDMPLDSVLNFFSREIGFEILTDGAVDVRVTMISEQPVTSDQAIAMLNAALKANGFTVVQQGRLLHISSREKLMKGNIPVHFGNDPADVADSDELITQIIPVQNVSATKLRDDLKPLIGPGADVAANEGSNSIIITDTSASIQRLVRIISRLDEHEAKTSEFRIVQLKHASAAATAKLIDTLFKSPATPQQPMQNGMPMRPGQPGQPAGDNQPGSEHPGQTVIAAADERTNILMIMASPETLKVIDEIVARLDQENSTPAPTAQLRAYPLKFAEADATAKMINDIFKPPDKNLIPYLFFGGEPGSEGEKSPAVNAVADERTNTVIVIAPAEKQKEVESLLQQLDASPMISEDMRVIHLKHADADSVAKLVQDMFQTKDNEESNPRAPYYILSLLPREQHVRDIKVKVSSDVRTNTLLVSAPSGLLDAIERVVHELDSDSTTEDSMFIYHLRNGQAAHMEYTLNVLFGNVSAANSQNSQAQQNTPAQQNQQNQAQNRSSLISNSSGVSSTSLQGNRNNQQSTPAVPQSGAQAGNELTGKVLVVADEDTNSLLVTTASKYEPQVKAIIAELDRPVPQVLIKCLVAEVTHDNSLDLGADFSVLNIRPSGNGQGLTSTLGAAAAAVSATAPPGMVARLLESNVAVTLQALAQANKLDVLSRPYILTSDNQEANITVGDEVPFITGSFTDSNGGVHNTIVYQDIGIILDVTPHINPDGLVVLDVNPQISALTGQTVSIQQGIDVPVFELRSASSRVAIRDGQTIVIGGLMQDQLTKSTSKIPVLGDIPLLGPLLFSYDTTTKTKTELLIFLTPHVASQPDELAAMSKEERQGTKLVPSAVGPGVFNEQMPGVRRGSIPQTQPTTRPISPVKSIDLTPSENDPPTNQPAAK